MGLFRKRIELSEQEMNEFIQLVGEESAPHYSKRERRRRSTPEKQKQEERQESPDTAKPPEEGELDLWVDTLVDTLPWEDTTPEGDVLFPGEDGVLEESLPSAGKVFHGTIPKLEKREIRGW